VFEGQVKIFENENSIVEEPNPFKEKARKVGLNKYKKN